MFTLKNKKNLNITRWLSLFTFYNILIALFISLRFYNNQAIPDSFIGFAFAITHSIGQITLLSFLVVFPLFLICKLIPQNVLKYVVVLISCLGLSLFFIDTFIYQQYRFHINAMVVELFIAGGDEVISFSMTMWLSVLLAMVCAFFIQLWVANRLYTHTQSNIAKKVNARLAIGVITCLVAAQVIHIWGDATFTRDVTKQTKILPLAYPATAKSLMAKYGLLNIEAYKTQALLKQKKNKGNLNYPIKPIAYNAPAKPLNIMMIVIDSWRADMASKDIMPNTAAFAENNLNYTNHYSGSNNTRHGMFSLMYGIPGTYWDAMLKQQQGPVLIKTLLAQNYQANVFASAKLTMPEFDQTLFVDIPQLRKNSMGESPWQRDADALNDYLTWQQANKESNENKPTFSLLFLDAAHGYSIPASYPKVFTPSLDNVNYMSLNDDYDAEPFLNLYKNSLHYIDGLIGQALDSIEDKENTVIIITSDHGKEFNDSKQGYWGHNSNYSTFQTKVPLFIHWPNKEAQEFSYQTSHMSIVPTLMKEALKVENNESDYSSGYSLLSQKEGLPWLFLGRSGYYAIKNQSHLYELDRVGNFTIFNDAYQIDDNAKLNINYVQKALQEMSRFYKK